MSVVRPAVAPMQESASPGVAGRPQLVAGPLEPEHRVEDVERDHREAVRGVGRAGGLEPGGRARLRDPLLQDLAVDRLAVLQDELAVDGLVVLAGCRVDADLVEQRVHAERARLVGDDRHDARPEVGVPDEVPEHAGEGHRRRDGGRRAGVELGDRRSPSARAARPSGRRASGAARRARRRRSWRYWTSSESGPGGSRARP